MKENLVQPSIYHKLNRLHRALRTRLAGEGMAWLLLALVAAVFATLGLDYLFHLPQALRVPVTGAASAVVVYVATRYLLKPLLTPMNTENLALLVERKFDSLGDRLISSLQFERMDAGQTAIMSEAMIAHTAGQANEMASKMDFNSVIERRNMWRSLRIAACGLMLLAGFGFWQPSILHQWFQRNVLFQDIPWPQNTYLEVVGGQSLQVLRGDDLEVVIQARADSVAPPFIILHASYPAMEPTEERLERVPEHPTTYRKKFEAVSEPFSFYVTGGDDTLDRDHPHAVKVIDPPGVLGLQFQVQYHEYMNRKAETFDGARGAVPVCVGSRLLLSAQANKDITSAALVLDGKEVGKMQVLPMALDKENRQAPRKLQGRLDVELDNKAAIKTLQIRLTDSDGYTNRRGVQYLLQLQSDTPPAMDLKTRGIGPRITPRATLPLQITARDDYGLSSMQAILTFVRKDTSRPQPPPSPVNLKDVGKEFTGVHRVDLADKSGDQKMDLQPGDTVGVVVEAGDNLPQQFGGPNTSRSNAINFSVVKPEELMEELVARQRAVRIEFMQTIKLQNDARDFTLAAASTITGQVPADARKRLADSATGELAVAAQTAKAAATLETILEEDNNNRLSTPEQAGQMQSDVIDPLKALADTLAQQVAALNGTTSVVDAAKLAQQAQAIAKAQDEILKKMEAIAQRMQKIENRADMANRFELLINWSKDLLKDIEKQKQTGIQDIFTPTTQP